MNKYTTHFHRRVSCDTHVRSRQYNANDTNLTLIFIDNNRLTVFALHARLFRVVYIRNNNWRMNTFKERHQSFNAMIKFMISNCLNKNSQNLDSIAILRTFHRLTIASALSIFRKWLVTFHLKRLYQRVPWKLSLNDVHVWIWGFRFVSIQIKLPSIQIQRIRLASFFEQFFYNCYGTSISTNAFFTSIRFTWCWSFVRFFKSVELKHRNKKLFIQS